MTQSKITSTLSAWILHWMRLLDSTTELTLRWQHYSQQLQTSYQHSLVSSVCAVSACTLMLHSCQQKLWTCIGLHSFNISIAHSPLDSPNPHICETTDYATYVGPIMHAKWERTAILFCAIDFSQQQRANNGHSRHSEPTSPEYPTFTLPSSVAKVLFRSTKRTDTIFHKSSL